jgi:hypothetical protein
MVNAQHSISMVYLGAPQKIFLAIFVQCNILIAMRAVEPRKHAANQANPQFRRAAAAHKAGNHDQAR